MQPDRIHLIAHGNPLSPDLRLFGMKDVPAYVAFARAHLPRTLRLTCDLRLLEAVEEPRRGGRTDDARRIRDLQAALDDPRTLAIVAASGGAYFSRLLPHFDLTRLAARRRPLWALGFSEMTTLIGLVASCRAGRGLYWLCPNFLGWRVKPRERARAALAEFWAALPAVLAGREPARVEHLAYGPVEGTLVAGRVRDGRIRIVGGCLAVLAAVTGGAAGRRLRPDGKWLLLEDIKEVPYRIDRHLASLKLAGWFERVAGVLVGDFHMLHEDTQPAVLELLRYHLPRRDVPIVATRSVGHVWPMVPVLLNRPVALARRGQQVTIHASPVPRNPNCRARSG